MFRKVTALVKLTGIFLLCISATSATPSGQLGDVQNINDDRDIHSTSSALHKPYQCEEPFVWVRRECLGANGPMAWRDVCSFNSFDVIYDYSPGSCPVGTTCLDAINSVGPFINCVSDDANQPMGKENSDPQVGKSDRRWGITKLGNTQQEFSVTIDHDMTGASVAAVFKSEC